MKKLALYFGIAAAGLLAYHALGGPCVLCAIKRAIIK